MSAHQPFELPPVQNKPRALRLLKWGAGLLLGAVAVSYTHLRAHET